METDRTCRFSTDEFHMMKTWLKAGPDSSGHHLKWCRQRAHLVGRLAAWLYAFHSQDLSGDMGHWCSKQYPSKGTICWNSYFNIGNVGGKLLVTIHLGFGSTPKFETKAPEILRKTSSMVKVAHVDCRRFSRVAMLQGMPNSQPSCCAEIRHLWVLISSGMVAPWWSRY